MPKIRHKQNPDLVEDISWRQWETNQKYQGLKHLWEIIDKGDPVRVYTKDKKLNEFKEYGIFDRDHAQRMIKSNPEIFYLEELSSFRPKIFSRKRLGLKYTSMLKKVEMHPLTKTVIIIASLLTIIMFIIYLVPLFFG